MGVWGTTPMNTGASQVFIEGDPQRFFGAFLIAQKGTTPPRPAGRNPLPRLKKE
jgi:hypothetical protein